MLCWLYLAGGASAQSTEIDFPTPVRSSEITGAINARDIGDARLTRHFYLLTGMPGDLTITVESKNLDGDIDLFTAGTLRPLAKVSIYSGESASRATKSIYLKRRESLVLRVEARSPDENSGSYRIRFEGSFEPLVAETPAAEETATPQVAENSRTGQKTRRVSSVGARIEEPEEEKTSAAKEPEPATQPAETATTSGPAETPSTDAATPPAATRTNRPSRSARNRQPGARRGRAPRPTTTEERPAQPSEPAPTVETGRAAETSSTSSTAAPSTSATADARLIIETRDGMRIERLMSTVRRVTVERGLVVIISKEGKVERQPLVNILRMSIEP
jgi:hypothetical protein